MIGPLINGYKGIKTNSDLKKRLAETEQQLDGIHSIEELLGRIDEPYNRVIAKNQFLLAEYYQQREQNMSLAEMKIIWEMVKEEMATNIQQTEQQLQEVSATKLDIARIVASLAQLSNEFDLELQALGQESENPDLEAIMMELQNHPVFQKLQTTVTIKSAELRLLKEDMQNFIAQLTEIKKKQLDLSTLSNTMHGDIFELHTSGRKLEREAAVLKTRVANLDATLSEALQQVNAAREAITLLEQSVDARLQKLQQQLHKQKSELLARADTIDAAILAQAKAQKKSLMQWTVPLYVLVAGIIATLYLL